jgi:hypothetical protein
LLGGGAAGGKTETGEKEEGKTFEHNILIDARRGARLQTFSGGTAAPPMP